MMRLRKLASAHPEKCVTALEGLVAGTDTEDWELRAHEDDIRAILEAALGSDSSELRARSTELVHRLGRMDSKAFDR